MASKSGATYKQILWHYYQGTEVGGEKAPPKIDIEAEIQKRLQIIDSATDVQKKAVQELRDLIERR